MTDSEKFYISPAQRASYWWQTLRHARSSSALPRGQWPSLTGELPIPNSKGIYFAACDRGYFGSYAEHYLRSIAQSGGRQSAHLHIYDGTVHDHRRVQRLAQTLCLTVTSTSHALARREQGSPFYFAAGRFVVLPELLRATRSPIICTDIDVLVRHSLDDTLAALSSSDLCMYLRPGNSRVWRKVLASTIIANPTAQTERYFDIVASTLIDILDQPLDHHVDQLILYYTYQLSRLRIGVALDKFAPLDQRLIDWQFHDDALIWNPKGQGRKDAYWRAVAQLDQPLSAAAKVAGYDT